MPSEDTFHLLLKALGIRNADELPVLANLPKLPFHRWRRFLRAIPAPTITSPGAGATVAGGRPLTVTIDTNAPELIHELVIHPKSDAGNPPAPVVVEIPSDQTYPYSITINVPAHQGAAGGQTEFYLEVRIKAGQVDEQQRHERVIKTATPLTVNLIGDQPTNPSPAAPYPAATAITYTLNVAGGVGPYSYIFCYGDAPPDPIASTPGPHVVLPAHPYAAGTYFAFVTVWDTVGNAQGQLLGPFVFA